MVDSPKKIGDCGVFEISYTDKFTSDHHFGHTNVIEYCSRPFCCKHKMAEILIQKWNMSVKPEERVFMLGDMFFGSKAFMRRIMSRLNGYKIAVKGNHDLGRRGLCDVGFDEAYLTGEATYRDTNGKELRLLMRHVPDRESAPAYDIHLCGHVHEKWCKSNNLINVGVDIWDYEPKTLKFILDHADERQKALPTQHTVDEAWEERNDKLIRDMYLGRRAPAEGDAAPATQDQEGGTIPK